MRLAQALLLAALVSCGSEVDETAKPETAPAAGPAPAEAADVVYSNGKIYTVNTRRSPGPRRWRSRTAGSSPSDRLTTLRP